MELLNKKAQIGKRIDIVVTTIISIVVLFFLFADLVPEAQSAGTRFQSDACSDAGCAFDTSSNLCDINSSAEGDGIACPIVPQSPPLSSLFGSSGVVIILLMVFLLLIVINIVLPKSRK